jgi:hypothetical protein
VVLPATSNGQFTHRTAIVCHRWAASAGFSPVQTPQIIIKSLRNSTPRIFVAFPQLFSLLLLALSKHNYFNVHSFHFLVVYYCVSGNLW